MAISQQSDCHKLRSGSLPLSQVDWLAPLRDHASVALVYAQAPAAEQYLRDAAPELLAATGRVIGYFDPKPVLLPWLTVAQNLVFGTAHDAAGPVAGDILALLGLCSQARRRAACLAPEVTLHLLLARAMLRAPDLLVVSDLARHPAVQNLRELSRLEPALGHLTRCRRLHLCSSQNEAALFCDLFLPAVP